MGHTADRGQVSETPEAENNLFAQARLLTHDRAELFSRSLEAFTIAVEDELKMWVADIEISAGGVEQSRMMDLIDGTRDYSGVPKQDVGFA